MSGPYMNEDGDWWVAVEDVASLREARSVVLGCLSYDVPGDGRLAYRGRQMSTLCDSDDMHHEVGPSCDASCHRYTAAYHFEERRPW